MAYKLLVVICLISFSTIAQKTTVKEAWLEKWENSKEYLVAIAEAMPEEQYNFKPIERQMSFAEQLQHIQGNIEWLGATYFSKEESEISINGNEKDRLIQNLENSFTNIKETIKKFPVDEFSETVDFFAGPKTKLQILNLMQDHVTHHRGQLIVYLNLNNITPPPYIGW